jgi:hypothetical protein
MKTIRTILLTLAAVIILAGGFFIGKKVSSYKVPAGQLLVSSHFLDSLKNLKPDTIIRVDTLEKIIYKNRLLQAPESTPDSTITLYTDSIINAYSRFVIRDWVKGELVNREVEYTPYIVQKLIREPYPVVMPCEQTYIKTATLQAFAGVIISRNAGVQIGLSTKKYYIAGQFDGNYSLILGRKFTIF